MAIVAAVFRVRKNGANATQFISVTSSQTGQFEDTTNSDNFISTDDINYSFITGGTTGTFTATHIGLKILNTDPTSALKDVIMCGGVIPWAR